MNFILPPPSLEHRAVVHIAVTLWSRDDVRYWKPKSRDAWKGVENIILEKASKLPLPTLLTEKVLAVIEPVGLQIQSWMIYHERYGCVVKLPSILFWTPHGTIDRKKTAEVLVKDKSLDLQSRFSLACCYCLEDDILDLWKTCFSLRLVHDDMMSFWCTYLEQTDDFHRMQTIFKNFECFANFSNEIYMRYFWLQLRSKDTVSLRVSIAKDFAYCMNFGDMIVSILKKKCGILFFLLSTLNTEQQAEIFEHYTYEVLRYLLIWPWQSLFLETAKSNWRFLSKERYHTLLHDIVDEMNCRTNYLCELFQKFWLQAPETYTQYVTNRDDIGRLLLALCGKQDVRNIQLILKDSSISVRRKLIFSDVGRDICKYFSSSEKWDSLEYLIQECISPEEMIIFRGNLGKYMA